MKELEVTIEKALRLLGENLPEASQTIKPTLLHAVRVGMYLYEKSYPESVVLAGFLHDVIEDTKLTHQDLIIEFSQEVADIVQANTKDESIQDRAGRYVDMVNRCQKICAIALIVKAADILDNLRYYIRTENQKGILHCINGTAPLLDLPKNELSDPIFAILRSEITKAQEDSLQTPRI